MYPHDRKILMYVLGRMPETANVAIWSGRVRHPTQKYYHTISIKSLSGADFHLSSYLKCSINDILI
jgi:hypothetical protein